MWPSMPWPLAGLCLAGALAGAALGNPIQSEDCPTREQVSTKVMVHYMIWFGEPMTRHWIWCNSSYFNRMTMGCNNTQHLATRFPPVGGAFASYDPEHVASDVQLMKSHCVDGIIIDYQQPPDLPGRSIIDRALPLVVEAVVGAGLEFAIMYDASSKPDWGRDAAEAAGVEADWRRIISLASGHRESYLQDAAGNLMFFLFGATPPPTDSDACPGCAFYAQDANDRSDLADAPGQAGAFAWIEPPKGPPLEYLSRFYRLKCSAMFPGSPTPCVGAAFVGMEAVYPSHESIPRSADLLREGLELCDLHGVICQVPTWNDFNEGTHIQPSYWCNGDEPSAYLRVIKDFKRRRLLGDERLQRDQQQPPAERPSGGSQHIGVARAGPRAARLWPLALLGAAVLGGHREG